MTIASDVKEQPSPGAAAECVDSDLPCGCGYNLRGLARAGRCPECGRDVAVAVRWHADPFAQPQPLRRMLLGLTIVLITNVAWLGILLLRGLSESVDRMAFWLTGASGPKSFIGPPAFLAPSAPTSVNLLIPLCHLVHLAGVWILTTPHAQGRAKSLRCIALALRWSGIAALLASAAATRLWANRYVPTLGWISLADAIVGALWGTCLAAAGLMLGRAKWLRIGGWIVAIGSGLFGAAFAAVFLVMAPQQQPYWVTMLWTSLTAWAAVGLLCTILLVCMRQRLRRELRSAPAAAAA